MVMDSSEVDSWRIFFSTVNTGIFDVINNAIMVAVKDHQLDLNLRRDQIVHLLYHHCCPCNSIEHTIPLEKKNADLANANPRSISCSKKFEGNERVDPEHIDSFKLNKSCVIEFNGETKTEDPTHEVDGKGEEVKAVNDEDKNQRVDHQDQILSSIPANDMVLKHSGDSQIMGPNGVSNGKDGALEEDLINKTTMGSHCVDDGGLIMNEMGGPLYEETEARKDLLSEGDETVEEVLRIKEVLDDGENQSDVVLLELLMKLQTMTMTMEILKATMIGKTISALRKHAMKEIRKVVRSLICAWRDKVDEWVQIENGNTEVVPLPTRDEFPFYPLNEVHPVAPSSSVELLQMFKDVDQTEFFSILPSHSMDGSFCFPEEQYNSEDKQLLVKDDALRDGMSERGMGEEDLLLKQTSPLQFMGTYCDEENKRPPIDENDLVKPYKSGNAREKDFSKQRVPSPLKIVCALHTVAKHKHSIHEKRRPRDESFMKRSTAERGRITFPKDKNRVKYGQKSERSNTDRQLPHRRHDHKMKMPESDALHKVEETRRKHRENYQRAEDAKKRRATQTADANYHYGGQKHKRHKQHHAGRRYVDRE